MPHGPQPTAEEIPQLRLQRRYPVAAEKVWRAWTEPQALMRWFGPGDCAGFHCTEMDVRPGGRYHIGFSTQDGERHDVHGEYLEVAPPTRLAFTWHWKSTPERVSRVTIVLRPVDGGTELDFVHDRFFDREAALNHARGWGATFEKLDAYLSASS